MAVKVLDHSFPPGLAAVSSDFSIEISSPCLDEPFFVVPTFDEFVRVHQIAKRSSFVGKSVPL